MLELLLTVYQRLHCLSLEPGYCMYSFYFTMFINGFGHSFGEFAVPCLALCWPRIRAWTQWLITHIYYVQWRKLMKFKTVYYYGF